MSERDDHPHDYADDRETRRRRRECIEAGVCQAEQRYRNGYQAGAAMALALTRKGVSDERMSEWIERLGDWRFSRALGQPPLPGEGLQ